MSVILERHDLDKFILIGDRVLIKPKEFQNKTKSGLYLPPGVHEKELIHYGYIIKVGPGYPVPSMFDESEVWKAGADEAKYIPLQVKVGDLAIYLQKSGYEIEFNNNKYIIVPHHSILMVIRDESLFK